MTGLADFSGGGKPSQNNAVLPCTERVWLRKRRLGGHVREPLRPLCFRTRSLKLTWPYPIEFWGTVCVAVRIKVCRSQPLMIKVSWLEPIRRGQSSAASFANHKKRKQQNEQ